METDMNLFNKILKWQSGKPIENDDSERTNNNGELTFPVNANHDFATLSFRKLTDQDFVIFLDFDGVLHRNYNESLEHIPLIEELLEHYENVRIIISSDWRLVSDADYLRQRLGENVWSRVIGATPLLENGFRSDEIMLSVAHLGIKQYVALDDKARLFSSDFSNLILTETSVGLTKQHLNAIKQQLNT
jgi:hypothetical protein